MIKKFSIGWGRLYGYFTIKRVKEKPALISYQSGFFFHAIAFGKEMVISVPTSSIESTVISPCCNYMRCVVIQRPRPVPMIFPVFSFWMR